MTSDAFRRIFGDELADQVEDIKANRGPSKIGSTQAQKEAQELKELCDGALNGVYGPEGMAIAERVLDGGRTFYTEREVKRQLVAAGLVKS